MADDPTQSTAETMAAAAPPDGLVPAVVGLLDRGGIAIWAIAALSVLTLAVILWKTWRLARAGAWRRDRAEAAVAAWVAGRHREAQTIADRGAGMAARMVSAAMAAVVSPDLDERQAREETTRVARRVLAEAGIGLRVLDVVATIAPLLGLLGTVLGMIAAFQAFQAAEAQATPADLAGGIWEALLTTAAGMAVAIPAAAALSWFESVIEALRRDMEDMATRIFHHPPKAAIVAEMDPAAEAEEAADGTGAPAKAAAE